MSTNKETAPAKCIACQQGRNCINGRYCTKLRQYTEHYSEPLCEPASSIGGKGLQE